MVPIEGFPPAMLSTLQFTALKLVPVTVAVNWAVCASRTEAFCGATTTVMVCTSFDEPEENPHPEMASKGMSHASTATVASARGACRHACRRFGDFCPCTVLVNEEIIYPALVFLLLQRRTVHGKNCSNAAQWRDW